MSIVRDLKINGITMLRPMRGIEDTVRYLKAQPDYPGHVKVYSGESNARCYDMKTVMVAPWFLRYALSFTSSVAEYLNTPLPRLYSVNAFWTYPDQGHVPEVQNWHTDKDDDNFVALFVYGTDVMDDDDGAHQYTKRDGSIVSIMGRAGTTFIEDPRRHHMGGSPRRSPRLLLWARWGVSMKPASYVWDKLEPVPKGDVPDYPTDSWLQRTMELIAA